MRPKPKISANSQRLISKSKDWLPIYSKQRLLRMSSEKRLNSLRDNKASKTPRGNQKLEMKETKKTSKKSSFSLKKTSNLNKSFSYSYSPLDIKTSKVLKPRKLKRNNCIQHGQSTEERDMQNNCSFSPLIDKKSRKIFKRVNTKNKPVLIRLMDYKRYGDILHRQIVTDSLPTFTPNLTKSKKLSKQTITPKFNTNRSIAKEESALGKLKNLLDKKSKKPEETIPSYILAKLTQ